MKEIENWMNSVDWKEEEKNRMIFKRSVEKEVNIPCVFSHENFVKNNKFIGQKRFYSVDETDNSVSYYDNIKYLDQNIFDQIDNFFGDDDVRSLFFFYGPKNFIFYQLGAVDPVFEKTIMNGKILIVINDKIFFIITENKKIYYYKVDFFLNGEINLEDEFVSIYDFLILNLEFLNLKDENSRMLKKYEIIQKNCFVYNYVKIYNVDSFDLSFFENFAKYKYLDISISYYEVLSKAKHIVENFNENKVLIVEKVLFFDQFVIAVYKKNIFFMNYPENSTIDDLDEKNLSFFLVLFFFDNKIFLNEYIK